jgi:hypothetical protein
VEQEEKIFEMKNYRRESVLPGTYLLYTEKYGLNKRDEEK